MIDLNVDLEVQKWEKLLNLEIGKNQQMVTKKGSILEFNCLNLNHRYIF